MQVPFPCPRPEQSLWWHWVIQSTVELFSKKVKAPNLPLKSDTFSEESQTAACKFRWIIRSLSVQVGTVFGYKDAAAWQRSFFSAHDAGHIERSDGFLNAWLFGGILTLILSVPLLLLDSLGFRLRGLSHSVDSRHWCLFLGCYHGNP